ncbi:1174_t:CDS:2, partial [Ambispora gerdemannii]
NLGTLTDLENTPLFSTAFDYTLAVIEKRVLNSLWPILEKFNEQGRKNREYCKVLDDFAFNIIQHRRREPLKNDIPTDILHLFMDARHDNGEELNDKELRDIILNLIIAGRDSTAN